MRSQGLGPVHRQVELAAPVVDLADAAGGGLVLIEQLARGLVQRLGQQLGLGIVVFDAQEVQGVASFEKNGALEIVFTNEGETADSWIERRVYDLVKSGSSVFVVTSDYAEQLNVLGSGAYRISAREFREEYLLTKKQIAQRSERLARGLGRNELGGRLQEHILDHFEKLRRNT